MKTSITIAVLLISAFCFAQHNHPAPDTSKRWDFKPIFNRVFTDSSFTGKELKVSFVTIPAGAHDTVTHIHDCHLVGYILEGEIVTKLKNKPAQHLRKGDIFYEFPKEIHESLQNLSKSQDAKILLYYLSNKGATLYKKLYE